ncbi:MAG: hypothetical protein PHP65_01870 [Bacilli bacterium]|nr:hypothetical protein [Bacilli bacterium]
MITLQISEKKYFDNNIVDDELYSEFLMHINLAHEFFHIIVLALYKEDKLGLNAIEEEYMASHFAVCIMNICSKGMLEKYLILFKDQYGSDFSDAEFYENSVSLDYSKILKNNNKYCAFQAYTYLREASNRSLDDIHLIFIKHHLNIDKKAFDVLAQRIQEAVSNACIDDFTKATIILKSLKNVYLPNALKFMFCTVNKSNTNSCSFTEPLKNSVVNSMMI